MKVIDLGCGGKKRPGAIGVDAFPFRGVDVVWNLNKFPYPFEDDSVDQVVMSHIIEHLDDPIGTLREAARILKPGGNIEILTPHFSSMNAYSDLTHKHAYSVHAFRVLTVENETDLNKTAEGYPEYLKAGAASFHKEDNSQNKRNIYFQMDQFRLSFSPLHDRLGFIPARWVGVEWLANHHSIFYEKFLAFLFPADEIFISLKVVKT